MDDIARLVAIEEIRQLKARYFHCVDHQQWDDWVVLVWTPDAELHVPDFRDAPFVGAATIAEWSASMMVGCVSIHHGYTPIIEIISANEARGLWAMEDLIFREAAFVTDGKPSSIHGWGHYHETYVKTDAGWRIAKSRLTRLRVEIQPWEK